MTAMGWWLRFPTEIAADLRIHCHGLEIADWHYGTRDPRGWLVISSRRLLELIDNLPDRSAFKLARDGWPEDTQILAKIHEENALYRASKYVGGNNEYVPKVFIPPHERQIAADESAEDLEAAMDLERLLSNALDK